MVRWPGKIKPGSVCNEIVARLDWLPTFLAMAGDSQVKEKLFEGYKVGDMTDKVHLDGDNLVPYLIGQVEKSPRESFFCINNDQQLTATAPAKPACVINTLDRFTPTSRSTPSASCRTPTRISGFPKCNA
jgi:hypothetical protein